MAKVKVTIYYDRVGLDCHTDGEVCERGYYGPGGWHYGTHQCDTCEADCGPMPETPEDIAACECEFEAREVIQDVGESLGAFDHAQFNGDHIMIYSADNCADFDDSFHESRQAAIRGDRRVLAILAHRLGAS